MDKETHILETRPVPYSCFEGIEVGMHTKYIRYSDDD